MNKKKRNIILAVSITAGVLVFVLPAVLLLTVARSFLHDNNNAIVSALNSEVYSSDDCLYYDRLISCVNSHGFDHVDTASPSNYLYGATPRYISYISVYISEDASAEEIEEVNELMRECCDICQWQDETEPQHAPMEVRATVYYFDDSEYMYYASVVVNAQTEKDKINVMNEVRNSISNSWRKNKDIPTEIDITGKPDDCLIIVR